MSKVSCCAVAKCPSRDDFIPYIDIKEDADLISTLRSAFQIINSLQRINTMEMRSSSLQ